MIETSGLVSMTNRSHKSSCRQENGVSITARAIAVAIACGTVESVISAISARSKNPREEIANRRMTVSGVTARITRIGARRRTGSGIARIIGLTSTQRARSRSAHGLRRTGARIARSGVAGIAGTTHERTAREWPTWHHGTASILEPLNFDLSFDGFDFHRSVFGSDGFFGETHVAQNECQRKDDCESQQLFHLCFSPSKNVEPVDIGTPSFCLHNDLTGHLVSTKRFRHTHNVAAKLC